MGLTERRNDSAEMTIFQGTKIGKSIKTNHITWKPPTSPLDQVSPLKSKGARLVVRQPL